MRKVLFIVVLVLLVIGVAVTALYLLSPFSLKDFSCEVVEVTEEYVKLAVRPDNSAEIVTKYTCNYRNGDLYVDLYSKYNLFNYTFVYDVYCSNPHTGQGVNNIYVRKNRFCQYEHIWENK